MPNGEEELEFSIVETEDPYPFNNEFFEDDDDWEEWEYNDWDDDFSYEDED